MTSAETGTYPISAPNNQRQFRILSLEGGGILGAFSASVLATLEKTTGHRCVEHFDLITGTSTGGIIAIGLGLGLTADEIVDFYREQGPIIFKNSGITHNLMQKIRHFFQPKHSHDVLRQSLIGAFGDRKFGESKCRLLIPTYNANQGRLWLLKTAHHSRFKFDQDALAVDVALATSAAPTYFSGAPFPLHEGASYVDGGVWANCPALAGLVEAVHFLDQLPSNIDILNIGTTETPFSVSQNAQAGLLGWGKGLIDIFSKSQVEASRATSMLITNGGFHHINYIASEGRFSLDDSSKVNDLIAIGRDKAVEKNNLEVVEQRFLNGVKAESFEPIHRVK